MLSLYFLSALQILAVWNSAIFQHAAKQGRTDAEDVWLLENYPNVRDAVLQKGCPSSGKTQSEPPRWEVCFRILPPFESDSEYEVDLKKYYDGKIYANIILPKGPSVQTQLLKLHRDHPDISWDKLTGLISTETFTGSEKDSSALRDLATEFENIRVSPVMPDVVWPDRTKYEIQSTSYWGMEVIFTLYGPDTPSPNPKDPLVKWAESAKNLLIELHKKTSR
jgi:hypothetical protein